MPGPKPESQPRFSREETRRAEKIARTRSAPLATAVDGRRVLGGGQAASGSSAVFFPLASSRR